MPAEGLRPHLRSCFNARPVGKSNLARRWLPLMSAVSGIQPVDGHRLHLGRDRMDASEWQLAFGANRLTHLHGDDERLPSDARHFLEQYGLPKIAVFQGLHPFELSFSPLTKPLVACNTLIRWGDFPDRELDAVWADQLVIGKEEFCNGHALHCVHRLSGVVSRIDVEISNPECFVNSDVRRFGESLLAAIRWSQDRHALEAAPSNFVSKLADQIKAIDPSAFDDENSFWPNLIAVAYDHHQEFWDVSCDPRKSKPRF